MNLFFASRRYGIYLEPVQEAYCLLAHTLVPAAASADNKAKAGESPMAPQATGETFGGRSEPCVAAGVDLTTEASADECAHFLRQFPSAAITLRSLLPKY